MGQFEKNILKTKAATTGVLLQACNFTKKETLAQVLWVFPYFLE